MDRVVDATLCHQHILIDMRQCTLVNSSIQHGIRVGAVISTDLREKLVHLGRVLG